MWAQSIYNLLNRRNATAGKDHNVVRGVEMGFARTPGRELLKLIERVGVLPLDGQTQQEDALKPIVTFEFLPDAMQPPPAMITGFLALEISCAARSIIHLLPS